MYSSLLRVDMGFEDSSGCVVLQQTDHRDADEIAEQAELSELFALMRVLNAHRIAAAKQLDEHSVVYVCLYPPPEFLRRVIWAAAGELEIEGEGTAAIDPAALELDPADLADRSFHALAERVAAEERVSLDADGLRRLEESVRQLGLDPDEEDDEIPYWEWIVKLAAVTGEILRRAHGGRWIYDAEDISPLPFVFEADNGFFANVLGKAMRSLAVGERESLAQLERVVEEAKPADGKILPNFKPDDWGGREQALCRPLLENIATHERGIPIVTFGEDQPNSFHIFTRDAAKLEDVEREAIENLADIEVEVSEIDLSSSGIAGLAMWVASDHWFASEKLLDREFMRSLHARIGSPLLAAGVPRKGVLMVTNGLVSPKAISVFMYILEREHQNSEESLPLTTTAFMVQDGEVTGVVRLQ